MKILDKTQIQQKINRIAYQLVEDNFDEQELILVGILPRGNTLATQLKDAIERIGTIKVDLLTIDIAKTKRSMETTLSTDVELCKNKVIVVVDDVLNSGRTLVYALGVFLNIPVKKIRTVALIDRSHRLFPINTDFVGVELSTVTREHIDVVLGVEGQEDAVYLR